MPPRESRPACSTPVPYRGLLTAPGDTSPAARKTGGGGAAQAGDYVGILEPAEGGIALHTAIIEACRASIDGSGPSSARIRHAAIELLAASTAKLPFDQPEAWPQYLLLGPHLLSLLDTAAGRVDREHLGLLMETTARAVSALQHGGASQAGSILCERALTHGAALGNEHRAVLRVRHEMAWAVADRGDLDEPKPCTGMSSRSGCECWAPRTKTSSTAATSSPGSPPAGKTGRGRKWLPGDPR